jgi:hypothetical protein
MKVNRPLGILYRFYLYLKERFDPKPKITEEERHAVDIAKKLIISTDSDLYLAPLSHKRIIVNEPKKIYVLIESRNITIINHVYSYNVYIENDELYNTLIDMFNSISEKKKEMIEKQIRNNIEHSLKKISESLSI